MPGDQANAAAEAVNAQKPYFEHPRALIVLALLAMAPLMFERVHGLEAARAERTERANAEVIDLARRGADAQARNYLFGARAAADRGAHL